MQDSVFFFAREVVALLRRGCVDKFPQRVAFLAPLFGSKYC